MRHQVVLIEDIKDYQQTIFAIDTHDAKRYIKSLLSVRKRLIKAFDDTTDGSLRKWINTHGPILDELLEDLGYHGK